MMRDALAGPRVIGMVLLKPGWEKNYEGNPDVYSIGCAGIVSHYQELEDGRYNLILLGQSIFRILGEEQGRAYRVARVEYRSETLPREQLPELAGMRQKAIESINALARAGGSTEPLLDPEAVKLISDEELPNLLSHTLSLTPLEKQALLEEEGLIARYHKLVDLVDFWRLNMTHRGGPVQ